MFLTETYQYLHQMIIDDSIVCRYAYNPRDLN